MTMIYLVAMRSKDTSTHIGAVIVGPDNEIRSTGYNSFPRGINDKVPERFERPEKYFWFEHAERNAIYNASLSGTSLKGCRMYTNGVPCMDCSRGIVQAGINKVIADKEWDDENYGQWLENAKKARQLYQEAGIELQLWEGKFLDITKLRNGKVISLKSN